MAEIGRLLTAMVTPFNDSGAVGYEQAQQLALALLRSGSDGVVVAGTTGEVPTLSHDEKVGLFKAVKQAVGGAGVVIAGTGNYNTAESEKLGREAEAAGVDGLLLTVPYYNKPTQEGLFRHFEVLAKGTSLPCIMYNIPGRTGVNMTAETTARLSRIPNIAGVKEASGNLEQIGQIMNLSRDGFRVWSGNDSDTLPILSIGGYGVICVVSHLVGLQMREIIDEYLYGKVEAAAGIHRRLLPLMMTLMTAASNPIPIKYALRQLGWKVGGLRLPLVDPDEAAAEKIMAEVRRHRIGLVVPA
ncbi:MAG TPA: 4-hydroxy-tetrahydrodipicolinate synthase [Dehalococcoidia bacterium]|nr:4-hydroxy-tetrahydrodipicolinate synthase [Dehalococcoidia bacterium]